MQHSGAGCIAMLLEAWSLPYLSLLTWIIFCVREEITSKWSRISFPLNVFVYLLLRMPGQEHQPGKGRRTNQKPVNQTLKTKKELPWMRCSPAQPSRWDGDPSWNQLKDNACPHLHYGGIYTKFQVTMGATSDSQYQIQWQKFKKIPCSRN